MAEIKGMQRVVKSSKWRKLFQIDKNQLSIFPNLPKVIPDKEDTHQPGFDSVQPSAIEQSQNHKQEYLYSRESPKDFGVVLNVANSGSQLDYDRKVGVICL